MDGTVPISGKTPLKSCQSVFTSSGTCAISGLSLPIKHTIGWLAVMTAFTWTLGFFLCASRMASLFGLAACTGRLSKITRFTPRSCNPRLSRCSIFVKKERIANFYAVGNVVESASRNCHKTGRSRGPKTAGNCSQYWPMRISSGARRVKNSCTRSSQWT